MVRHTETISEDWMDEILAETARRCLAEAGDAAGPLASDSSALETTRYEEAERPDMKERDFVQVRQKIYWKYHIAAVLGLHIVLAAFGTPGNANDTVMLRTMLAEIRSRGFGLSGRRFNADRGYDSDTNCEVVFLHGMILNIKQRKDAVNRSKPSRKKAAGLSNPDEYRLRAMIEGIFGAEESRGHQMRCRLVRADNRRRFVKGGAIAWNIRVLNRFEHVNRLCIPIPSYGA